MDKYFYVIGYTSFSGREQESKHMTEVIFCNDDQAVISKIQEIYRKDRCEETCTSQFYINELDDYLIKLYPDGSQKMVNVNISNKFRSIVSLEIEESERLRREEEIDDYMLCDGWNDCESIDDESN